MRIAMIGSGYVGLVSGICFSDFGHDVVCVDRNAERIAALRRGEIPIFEPGLAQLMAANAAARRLGFTTDTAEAVRGADAIFISVGTPARRGDGHADLTYVYRAAEDLAPLMDGYAAVVVKSTVPIGTNAEVARRIRATAPKADFDVVSNPEFLREGAAIEDFMRPDRIVAGVRTERAKKVMTEIYRPLFIRETPMVFTSPESAEMIKYAANAFLATKITFINEIADLCETCGADVLAVAKGIGLDGRIGPKFLNPGPGYGGSCFPKDTSALLQIGRERSRPMRIVETVVSVNDARKRAMAEKIRAAMNGRVSGKRLAVLGVTFKPNTDDMREAPSLTILPALIDAGAKVIVADPEGRKEGEALLPGVVWAEDAYEAAQGADALIVLTEWNQFRGLDLARLARSMRGRVMVDLRNIHTPEDAEDAGFDYTSIGRG